MDQGAGIGARLPIHDGIGLGFPVVRRIAAEHGGVVFTETLSSGGRVGIRLPLPATLIPTALPPA
jgi:hypothetical protein